jgi:diguanylate cyclase (GGDEF)-like protein
MPNTNNTGGTEKRRLTVGFFVSELENAYAQTLCRGIMDAAASADANVMIFPGKSPKVPYDYRYQYNSIYRLANKDTVDALILATGTMVNFLSDEEFKEFYGRYSDIPLVSISIPIDGVSSVLIDNTVGLRGALNHLVEDHGYDRIAFIGGPESNVEAKERYAVYKDVLRGHGVPFDPDLVALGDFTKYSGVRAVGEFLDVRRVKFRALAAANDEMALSAMEELQRRGYRIPEDIAVVGFDNVESTHFSSPTLTTVAQPIYEQAYKSVELALGLIKGEPPVTVSLPTSMVIRESCGCFSRSVTSVSAAKDNGASAHVTSNGDKDTAKIEALLQKAFNCAAEGKLDDAADLEILREMNELVGAVESHRQMNLRLWQNTLTNFRNKIGIKTRDLNTVVSIEDFFHKMRMLLLETYFKNDSRRWSIYINDIVGLRDVLSQLIRDVNNPNEALRSIVPNIRDMGISDVYVFLHYALERHSINTDWCFTSELYLAVTDDKRRPESVELRGQSMPVASILDRSLYPKDRRYTFIVSALFYMDEHMGFVVCEPDFVDIHLVESLMVEISCSLKLINLIQARRTIERQLQSALEELEKYNEQLSSISETDELTKLLNRRGFMAHARHMLGMARRMKKDGLLFFADLDGLKGINDTYGHEEGDNAIKEVAVTLKKAFRDMDIIARLGGDEFTVFAMNANPGMIEIFEKRIAGYVEDYNRDSKKPYKVSVSIGGVPFLHTDSVSIETLMNKADVLLYQQKKEKKAKLLKG